MRRRGIICGGIIVILMLLLSLYGCQNKRTVASSTANEKADLVSNEILYIFEAVDPESKMVYLVKADNGADAEFKYNDSTDILSENKEVIVAGQLTCGELVWAKYSLESSELVSLHSAGDGWKYDTYGGLLNMDTRIGGITVGDGTYKYDNNLKCYSNGIRIDYSNIAQNDKVMVRGLGKQIYSIVVTGGHGRVRMTNVGDYNGGWIEVGKVISTISENKLLDIPEGSYSLRITRKNYYGSIDIEVKRDEELVVDLSTIEETKGSTGIITFDIKPETASVYLGNSKIDWTSPVELPYGKYYLVVKAEGYETYGGTIILGKAANTISIELDPVGTKDKNNEGSSSSGENSSGAASSDTGSSKSSEGSRSSTKSSVSAMDSSARQSILQSIQDAQTALQNSLIGMGSN